VKKTLLLALPLLVIPALLAGCASPATETAATPSAVTVDNCGFELTVTTPPQRIVTIKSTSTELLIALGLGDRVIGQAFPDGPLPEELAGDDIPVISDFAPSEEAVLDLEPDFVFGGWESNFTADAAGDREELKTLGIGSYVAPAACKEPGYQPDPLTWDRIFDGITEAGDIFGVRDEADALVADQRRELATIEKDGTGRTALWWSSGNDTPYVGAGIGAPQLVLDTIGLTNIAADVDDTWTSYSWEAIIAANPDVIVLVGATWNTAAAKLDFLESNPATMNLDAVTNHRYLFLPFAAGEAGVRSVSAAGDLATQLAELG
jgi:iron complex transport system substrate-binding protein